MKKILSGLLALVMIISCMAITVSAAGITIGPLPNIDCVIAKAPSATGMTDNEWTLLRETNQVRWNDSKNGPLTTFSKLNEAAGIRAEELPKLFSHTRPNGTSCTTVIAEVGLPETAVGENIASMSSADDTPAQVVDIWRNSPGHYATMMGNWNTTVIEVDEHGNQTETKRPVKDFYRHMGVGQYTNDWVQVFYSGNPSSGEYTEDELEMFGYDECCNYTKLSITKPSAQFSKGTSITDMNLIGVLTCDKHGQGYFPVLSEYCSGYDANKTGKQTVTVTVYGLSSTVDVNIKGSVEPQPTEPTPTQPTEPKPSTKFPFTDVKSGTWYYNAVKYTYDNGLMNGVSDTKFDPEGTMTRGMLVTVLYRYDGSPSVSGKSNPFKDVKSGAWYTDAVKWAYANGITMGTSATKFSPDDKITREQIVTIFYRYADYKNLNVTNLASLSGYRDAGKVADYAKTAFQWAVANGIVNGTSSTTLSPRNNATRAECATIIQRFAGWANEG